jgi:hypothetical protein
MFVSLLVGLALGAVQMPGRVCPATPMRASRVVAMSAKKAYRPKAADPASEAKLLAAVGEQKRDLAAIGSLLEALSEREGGVKPEAIVGGWQLRWVSSAEALEAVGTGLHKISGVSFEELFLSIGTDKSKRCEANEVLRVFGPFPSVRNVLSGSYSFEPSKGKLRLVYTEMIDGLGKELTANDGSTSRIIDLDVRYAGKQVLVARAGGEALIFERVESIKEELIRLRVLKRDAGTDGE